MKKQLLSLLLLWVSFSGFGQNLSASTKKNINIETQKIGSISTFSPIYFMQSPQRLLDYWGDEVLAVSQYSEKERSFQEKVNETLAKTFVLAHVESKDEDFTNDNYRIPLEQRLIDNEPITPYTWKWVSFEIRPESGGVESVKLCRPNWFLRQLGATALGKMVYLSIPETGIMGNAIVTQISPCQLDTRLLAPKQKGEYEYRPITGQFQHQQAEVWDFEFSDGSIIGATANHPFFSLERGAYIAVGDLKIGEAVKNVGDKTLTLTKKTLRPNPETVYNIEVYRDHTYLVGNDGVLVHNNCLIGDALNLIKKFKRAGVAFELELLEGIERPNSNSGHGLIHILERHSVDFYPAHAKETLFPSGTTIDQIADGISEVFEKGTRASQPNATVQTFEKRIKVNGESANYRLIVDTANKYVVTFFKIAQ